MLRIGKSFQVETIQDVWKLNIIDFQRLNGSWPNPAEASETVFSWLRDTCIVTVMEGVSLRAPERDDFPAWDHVGGHERVARKFWAWFRHNYPRGTLRFGDSPDFFGRFEPQGSWFYGDIGQVSPQAFMLAIKKMSVNDLWISLLNDGATQVLIEAMVDIHSFVGR